MARDITVRRPAYLYDLIGTLVEEKGRLEYFRDKGVMWCDKQYGEPHATSVYSRTVIEGISNGSIIVIPFPTSIRQLYRNLKRGAVNIVYSSGTPDEIAAVLEASGLRPYVSCSISTFDLQSGNRKTKENIIKIFRTLWSLGYQLEEYRDDNPYAVAAAKEAACSIKEEYEVKVRIHISRR